MHLFPWSGIVNEDSQLSDTFRVPDPKTGQMRRLISQIPPKEEEMFRNMIRRLNTIVKVITLIVVHINKRNESENIMNNQIIVDRRGIGRPYNDRC